MTEADLCLADIGTIGAAYRRGVLAPPEVVEALLSRIARLDSVINSFITVTADAARGAARQAAIELRQGHDRGPLHGIPVSLKDLVATADARTTAGSRLLADWVPSEDAAIVARLREAGAVLIGKNNLHEFGFGVTSVNPHYGPVRNPWNSEHMAGGSSGGSAAATAAGLGYASIGTDTGGSIRRPAAFCGVVGLKPTYGRVSRRGILPGAWSLDHVGPLARTVRDAALVLDAIADRAPRDQTWRSVAAPPATASLDQPVAGLRLGIPVAFVDEGLTAEARAAFWAAVDALLGAGMERVDLTLDPLRYSGVILSTISLAEVSAAHRHWFPGRAGEYGPDSQALLAHAGQLTAAEYLVAQRARRAIAEALAGALGGVDVIVAPTTPGPAPRIDGGPAALGDRPFEATWHYHNLNRAANLAGLPALALPGGWSATGLPLGLQVIGRAWDEATVARVAGAIERRQPTRPWEARGHLTGGD